MPGVEHTGAINALREGDVGVGSSLMSVEEDGNGENKLL